MANVNSLMTNSASSTSNLYGTRNVLSGLASGMDTEAMIENSVSGYKTKITQLQKEQTKCEWKQDAYRSITDKMYDLTQKYTSYTSKTNLYSNAFFTNSINTETAGVNKDNVSATGKSSSDIQIYAAQAATAARYAVSASELFGSQIASGATGGAIEPDATVNVGKLKGSMTLTYGKKTFDIDFNESDTGITSLEELGAKIKEKLGDASDSINVDVSGGKITFSDKQNKGNSPYISSVSGNLSSLLGVNSVSSTDSNRFSNNSINDDNINFDSLSENASLPDYLNGKTVYVELDGVGRHITLDGDAIKAANGALDTDKLAASLQEGVNKAFGSNRVTVTTQDGGLKFDLANVNSGSTLSVKGGTDAVGEKLGLSKDGLTNYLNTGASIGTLLGGKFDFSDANAAKYDGPISKLTAESKNEGFYKDSNGNRYQKVSEGSGDVYYRVNSDDDKLYELKINDKSVYVSEKSSMSAVINAINNSDMGVNASYSKLTGEFVFTSKETGASSGISFGDGLAQSLFGSTDVKGTDATILASVNGKTMTLERASNSFDMDGMTVTIKNDFGTLRDDSGNLLSAPTDTDKADAVSFSTKSDSDSMVSTIKTFVDEYNALLKELHDAYATQPAEKSSKTHARYEPLTDDDKADMSDKAVENYEAKAKQGLLFGDNDLRAAYDALVKAFSPGGSDGAALRNMGIDVSYSGGLTQIKLDESKLRTALDSNPDKVREAFTKSKENGASSNGLMTSVKSTLEQYGSTSIANNGILVKKAGNAHSSTSLLNNELQKRHDSLEEQIENWRTKMGSKIDYYTRQFTALEKLMNTMNSQSSALSGLMGGY